MKIDKAIEYLKDLELTLAPTRVTDGTDALELGIEALKNVKKSRYEHSDQSHFNLPGETEK